MNTYRLTLAPRSAFGTPLAGDTLFGQLCWTLRRQQGNERLTALLDGYIDGQPFAVVSDGMPAGFLPLPGLPSRFWAASTVDRKALKKRRWLRHADFAAPLSEWQSLACSDVEAAGAVVGEHAALQTERSQPHNSINRSTGTTGEGRFAPYTLPQQWFHPAMRFDIYVVLDENRLPLSELQAAFADIGRTGYGRDASIGLGKFIVDDHMESAPLDRLAPTAADAWLTLGPVVAQGQGFCPQRSYYQPLTRFGRHGDVAIHAGNPFKRPLLMARGGSVFRPTAPDGIRHFVGRGLSGVSDVLPETVHQGYAPVLGLCLAESWR